MNTDFRNRIRQTLASRLEALQGTACRTVSAMKDGAEPCADPMDHAILEHDRQVELTIRGHERSVIRNIQEALRRIDRGLFGICVVCGSSIGERRLLAEPTTRLCRSCRELEESGERDGRNGSRGTPVVDASKGFQKGEAGEALPSHEKRRKGPHSHQRRAVEGGTGR
ncbi:MAG: RNA polymerase-binding protein DksA [Syntrophaceae bacterium]|nr:RNA polymerase-binding protein DksA [Syntrophaceae bacterium]